MYNHNEAQQSKIRVHISWDVLYVRYYEHHSLTFYAICILYLLIATSLSDVLNLEMMV